MRRATAPSLARGFTLIEILIAVALAAVVLSALQSLIVLAGKAVPASDGRQMSTVEAVNTLERLTAEVSVAVEVLEITSTSITFSLNDWTGDDVVETVKYAWSGVAGDPLLRAVNGGDAAVIAESVESFDLDAVTTSVDVYVEAEQTKQDDEVVQRVDVVDYSADWLTPSNAYAQRIIPDLPADTLTWRIRDVSIWVYYASSSSGKLIAEIRGFDTATSRPNNTVYKSKKYSTNSLDNSLTRIDLNMNAMRFGPDEEVCIVIRAEDSGVSLVLMEGPALSALGGRISAYSSNGGSTWTTSSTSALQHEVTADIVIDPSGIQTRTFLSELEATLVMGTPSTTITRSIRPLNTPEVVP